MKNYMYSYHLKIPQSLHNRYFFFLWTLWLFSHPQLCLIIILPLNYTTHPLYLRNIQITYLQPTMLQHILLNLLISRLTLRLRQIHLIKIYLHLNMMLGIQFGQQTYRLDVNTKLEHIPTKSLKYGQYLYSTNTVRASLFPQNIYFINFAPP